MQGQEDGTAMATSKIFLILCLVLIYSINPHCFDETFTLPKNTRTSQIAFTAREFIVCKVAEAIFGATLLQYIFISLLAESIRERLVAIPLAARYTFRARNIPFLHGVIAIRFTAFVLDIHRICQR